MVGWLDPDPFCISFTMLTTGVRKVFRSHGEFCSTQPWEVIVATLTFLVCILTVWGRHNTDPNTQLRTELGSVVKENMRDVMKEANVLNGADSLPQVSL